MNLKDWSLQKAIEDRVKLEDMVEWARSEVPKPEEAVMKKELPSTKWNPTPQFVLIRAIKLLSL